MPITSFEITVTLEPTYSLAVSLDPGTATEAALFEDDDEWLLEDDDSLVWE